MKRMIKQGIAALLALGLIACTPTTNESKGVTGTFSGTGKGFEGDVSVTLHLEDSKLTDIEISGEHETPNVGGKAIEALTKEMKDQQTINVDGVSGATYTSDGVKTAIDAALQEAGLTREDFPTIQKAEAKTIEKSTTLLILGGGGAGLACANAAIDAGLTDVTILEKMPYTGGATANAGGVDAGLSKLQSELGMEQDSEQLIHDDIMRSGEGHNEDLVWLMAKNQGKMLDWAIESQQIPFNDRYPGDFPEHTVQRFFVCEGGMAKAIEIMTANFTKAGGTLALETKAEELLTDEQGRVIGVRATDRDGNTINYKADAVVVATGGYGANQEMISQKKGDLQYAVFYGVNSSMGDGHLMGEKIGAKMTNMGYAKMYPNGISKGTDTIDGYVTPMPSLQAVNGSGAIFINKDGKRFVDETLAYADIKNATTKQPDEIMYILMDQAGYDIWSKAADTNSSPIGKITLDQQEKFFASTEEKPVFAKGTLDDISAKTGISKEAMEETITKWNEEVQAGDDSEFHRSALYSFDAAGTVYLVEQRLRYATTLGGYDVTANCEAQTEDGKVIPGLYAIGEVVGGPNGTEAIPGSMASWAMTSGYVCGSQLGEQLAK